MTIPTDLKNRGAYFDCEKDTDQNDNRESTGKVPRAKKSITESPPINDPLERAAICIDCVNPQGRKNVPTPTIIGINMFPHFFLKKEKKLSGRVNVFLNTPMRLSPRSIITREAAIPSTAENIIFIPIASPMIPRRPPRRANPIILAP